jgi:hypothetical protein
MDVDVASQLDAGTQSLMMYPLLTVMVSLCMAYIYQQTRRETRMGNKIPGREIECLVPFETAC